jgi:Raf kinase inhibitor-like YbhB/YbcL family protein
MEEKMLKIHCSGIENGKFHIDHTGRGADRSPELVLENLSPAAVTLAVTLEDMSHPIKNFTHWVIWNLPAADRIPGAIPAGKSTLDGAVQGVAYGLHRYAGPKPPRRTQHTYRFTVYALDCALDLHSRARKKAFLRAAEGHVLQRGSISGIFAS